MLALVALTIGAAWWWLELTPPASEAEKSLADLNAPTSQSASGFFSTAAKSSPAGAAGAANKIAPGLQALDGVGVADFPTTPKLDAIRKTVRENPNDPWPWQELGYDYAVMQRADLALDALAQARAHDDKSNGLHSRMGWAYFNLGHADEALREWQNAYELSGGKAYYDDYCLSLGHWANGDTADALRYYQASVEKDPSFGDVEAFQKRVARFTARERRMFDEIFDAWRKSYAPREPRPAPAVEEVDVATPAEPGPK